MEHKKILQNVFDSPRIIMKNSITYTFKVLFKSFYRYQAGHIAKRTQGPK